MQAINVNIASEKGFIENVHPTIWLDYFTADDDFISHRNVGYHNNKWKNHDIFWLRLPRNEQMQSKCTPIHASNVGECLQKVKRAQPAEKKVKPWKKKKWN